MPVHAPAIRRSNPIRGLNRGLFAVNIIVALYIILAPLIPEASFFVQYRFLHGYFKPQIANENLVTILENASSTNAGALLVPKENTLIINGIGVDGIIYEGNDTSVLQKGIWRRPNTGTPDTKSNTVLVAHRFLYTKGPNTFYNLDKIKNGDVITVYWNRVVYTYEVFNTEVVPPSRTDIENPTSDPILTLYTCTPLFTSSKRMVVQARLISPV